MRKWEYFVHYSEASSLGPGSVELQQSLDHLGQQGWELVSVVRHGESVVCFLKRPVGLMQTL